MLAPVGDQESPVTEVHVVLNWGETLARLAPARRWRDVDCRMRHDVTGPKWHFAS
jgi:hypothetical protein